MKLIPCVFMFPYAALCTRLDVIQNDVEVVNASALSAQYIVETSAA